MSELLTEERIKNAESNKLSPTMRYAIVILQNAIKDILCGNCSEEEVAEIASKLNPERHGMINPDNYINYDDAMKQMPFGYNRNKLNALTKKYGIETKRINNMAIGFNRKDIELLVKKIKEEEGSI
jgi:hypothetical protein